MGGALRAAAIHSSVSLRAFSRAIWSSAACKCRSQANPYSSFCQGREGGMILKGDSEPTAAAAPAKPK